MQELDPRIVRVGIEVDGLIKYYDGLAITATGTKYANATQNDCEVTIFNMDRATRDYILTETSPFNPNRTTKRLILEAGRVSYGMTQIFFGDVVASSVTQPPDIGVKLKTLTADSQKGNIIARNSPAQTRLSTLSKQVAGDLGLSLNFQANEKNIGNYTFTGGALKQVDKLGDTGNVNVYVDDGVLVVKDYNVPLTGKTRILNLDTGMIGIPELTEQGVRVKFLLDNQTTLGGALQITSEIYPAINGTYVIYKLSFDIANRDTPFYWVAECKRTGNPNA